MCDLVDESVYVSDIFKLMFDFTIIKYTGGDYKSWYHTIKPTKSSSSMFIHFWNIWIL